MTGYPRALGIMFALMDGTATVASYATAKGLVVGRVPTMIQCIVAAIAGLVVFYACGLYQQSHRSQTYELWRVARAVLLLAGVLAIATFRVTGADWASLVVFAPLVTAAILGGRALARVIASTTVPPRRLIISGDRDEVKQVIALLDSSADDTVETVGVVCDDDSMDGIEPHRLLGRSEDLPSLVRTHLVDEVIVAPSGQNAAPWRDLAPLLLQLEEQGVVARFVMKLPAQSLSAVSLDQMSGLPLLTFAMAPRRDGLLLMRRWVDATLAFGLLALLSPLLALSALAIKLSSPGPVLFQQTRCGLHGRPFTFLKFRSMWIGAESLKPALARYNEMSGPAFKMTRDPRVTPVGQLLRRTSLDELPQIWNILRGDMSFVGPRPAVVEEVVQYEPWQRRRLSMKPGLTCLWQISGRSELDFDEWIRLDLEYIDNWSPWLDLKIVLKTIPAVLLGRGAR